MWEIKRVIQVTAKMKRYNLELFEISETYLMQLRQQRAASGELLLYSDHEEEKATHTQKVVMMLNKLNTTK